MKVMRDGEAEIRKNYANRKEQCLIILLEARAKELLEVVSRKRVRAIYEAQGMKMP